METKHEIEMFAMKRYHTIRSFAFTHRLFSAVNASTGAKGKKKKLQEKAAAAPPIPPQQPSITMDEVRDEIRRQLDVERNEINQDMEKALSINYGKMYEIFLTQELKFNQELKYYRNFTDGLELKSFYDYNRWLSLKQSQPRMNDATYRRLGFDKRKVISFLNEYKKTITIRTHC